MTGFKILFDTNVVIGLEDARPVLSSLSELVRLSGQYGVGIFVDAANYDDISRDTDAQRQRITFSKLDKFQRLERVPSPPREEIEKQFGPIKNPNDLTDIHFLIALSCKAVDFLITQDNGLHKRADIAGLGGSVLTIEEALEWLRQTFQEKKIDLPYVVQRKAYEINLSDTIFESLRSDYDGFDVWFDRCRREHRLCWVLEVSDGIAGLVIRKEEDHSVAGTKFPGNKILKICTLKVREEFRGEKFGELLLKQILWFAQRNSYDLVYLTAYPKHAFLVDLLKFYGFEETKKNPNGELVLEKQIIRGALPTTSGNALENQRKNYPRFHDYIGIRKFCVPIQADYHKRLFPEIAFGTELPLFPNNEFGPLLDIRSDRTPGNTIRKVYLCRAPSNQLRPGDLIFFYVSKDSEYAASQSITTVGAVEQITLATSTDDLIKLTAKRSVFSAQELERWGASASSPVKLIDFLLAGHVEPTVKLSALLHSGVFVNRPPQSITELPEPRYSAMRSQIRLAYDL